MSKRRNNIHVSNKIMRDAFLTVKQESLYTVLTLEQEISGPPGYLTGNLQGVRYKIRSVEARLLLSLDMDY